MENPGLERLLQRIRAALDSGTGAADSALIPPKQKTRANGKAAKQPDTLHNSMEQETKVRIAEKFSATAGRQDLFLLSKSQIHNLHGLDVDASPRQLIQELNGNFHNRHEHTTSLLLRTIATLPPATGAGWSAWWLQCRDQYIGLYQSINAAAGHRPELHSLWQVVQAMSAAALEQMPTYRDAAEDLKRTAEPLKLSQVYILSAQLRHLGLRTGRTGEEMQAVPPGRVNAADSPEQMLEHLQQAGFKPEPDMGSIAPNQDLTQLKQAIGRRRTADIRAVQTHGGNSIWCPKDTANVHPLPVNGEALQPAPDPLAATEVEVHQESNVLGRIHQLLQPEPNAERALARQVAPGHPLDPRNLELHGPGPDAAAQLIAHLSGNTPANVQAHLDSTDATPPTEPPEPELCPRYQECLTWCGRLQRTGEARHPLTADSSHRSCGYWQFLETYSGVDPEAREFAAEQTVLALQEQAAEKDRRQRKQERALRGTEREYHDEDDTDEQLKAEAQEAAPQQASLL